MRISLHTLMLRTALAVVTVAATVIVAGPALAGDARPAASFYTPQQLQAMSANWAAKGRLLGSPDAASFYTPQQLQAMSANWAAKGRLLGNYTAQTVPPVSSDSTFAWPEFGIGAGAMLGVLLILGGAAVASRYSRHSVRARPAA